MEDLVSVIIPTYNVENYIEQTVKSALGQTYGNIEVICLDDCSTDRTYDILNTISDRRLIIRRNAVNSGAGITRSAALRLAKGRYIAFLDADDIWHADKLHEQISFMKKNEISFSFSPYNLINENGVKFGRSAEMPSHINYGSLLYYCPIRTSTVIYDASTLGRDLSFVDQRKRQDYIFFLNLIKRSKTARSFNAITCSYRIHPESVSAKKWKNIPFQWSVYYYHEKLGIFRSVYYMTSWFTKAGMKNIVRRSKLILTYQS